MSLALIRSHRLFSDVEDHQAGILNSASIIKVSSGEVVCREGESGDQMFVVLAGRVQVTATRSGKEEVLAYLGQGEHFGEMSLLMNGQRTATVTAVMESHLLKIDYDLFHRLVDTQPRFSSVMCQSLAHRLRRQNLPSRRAPNPKTIGVVSISANAARIIPWLIQELEVAGESVGVISTGAYEIHSTNTFGAATFQCDTSVSPQGVYEAMVRQMPRNDRVLVTQTLDQQATMPHTLAQCERVLVLAEASEAHAVRMFLTNLLARAPELQGRFHLVWLLSDVHGVGPDARLEGLATSPDFKVIAPASERSPPLSPFQSPTRVGLRRVVRFLKGTRLGLALGGGGARGLAHLGVLKAFEESGIEVDLVSGTSMGALMAIAHCAGWSPDESLARVINDLKPSGVYRCLPFGKAIYMMMKFWTDGWESMLRKHFGDVRLEQLQIPLSMVTVDINHGEQVIRSEGDAISALLESINLPSIARPIIRHGRALVDGGVLNNVPVDLLRPQGADLVFGVDVCRPLAPLANLGTRASPWRRTIGRIQTIMRIGEIQRHRISAAKPANADFLLSIDASRFCFHDFTKAPQLARLGEQATRQVIPKLHELMRPSSPFAPRK